MLTYTATPPAARLIIGERPDGGYSIAIGGQNLRELLIRVRGLLSVYAPMHHADATLDDLTKVIDALSP